MASTTICFLHYFMAPFILMLFLPVLPIAQTPQNVSLGSSLTPLGQTTSWPSPSGDFAVGFRRLESDSTLFLLAVWFDKVAGQTVVWAANRNKPVRAGSKFELTSGGRLVLRDQAGEEIWSAGGGVANVTHAAMLDSGNLILVRGGSSAYAWQSFDEPLDTILPSQVLRRGARLFSRLMESDYSDGRFLLAVQDDGNLVLYPTAIPSCPGGANCTNYHAYWASNTVGDGNRLVFDSEADIYFVLNNGSLQNLTSAKSYSTKEYYHRATLDPDGPLRQYIYPRSGTGAGGQGGEWMVAETFPSEFCTFLRTEVGSGVCGFNSYCSPDAGTQRLTCKCPPQYSFLDPGREYKGCGPDFSPQSCTTDGGRTETAGVFQIMKIPSIDWPTSDYEHLQPTDMDECSNACLNDCFCAVAIHRGDECWKKKLPLSNGRYDTQDLGTALLKVRFGRNGTNNNNSMLQPPNPQFRIERNGRTWLLVLSGGGNALLLAAIFLLTLFFHHKKMQNKLQTESSKLGTNLHSFTYEELQEATQGFKEELGRGAFGVVYKGLIESDSRILIAVKRLQDLDAGVEKEFTNEVRIIAQTHHKNLVRLLGYCNEGPHRLLVYECMSNGSLISFLLGSEKPDWNTRTQIAFGVARGLLYLHEECNTQIIHCDIKPQNILLDDCFNARISDFGLAKLLRADQTRTHTSIRGTRGYVAPDWFKHTAITSKVDVYSFGVLLLEIICCRKNVEPEVGEGERTVLVYWAYDCFREGRLDVLVGNDLEQMADVRRVERFVMVALWCIQEEPSMRPTMKKVTQMLEGAVDVPIPPDPSSYLPSIN